MEIKAKIRSLVKLLVTIPAHCAYENPIHVNENFNTSFMYQPTMTSYFHDLFPPILNNVHSYLRIDSVYKSTAFV